MAFIVDVADWQRAAAAKIVEQITDGTLARVAAVGSRIARTTPEDAMRAQIVAILLTHTPDNTPSESPAP